MNEAETPAELIDPQLKDFRAKKLTADYVLVYKGIKLAVVETKSDELGVGVAAQANIFAFLNAQQKEFIDFVLSKYIETGVEQLGQEKLATLLNIKYHSLEDAKDVLGNVANISSLFIEFQKHLYEPMVA
jgi:hypothetical protein